MSVSCVIGSNRKCVDETKKMLGRTNPSIGWTAIEQQQQQKIVDFKLNENV